MIFPQVIGYLIVKLRLVIGPLTAIEDPIVRAMPFLKKLHNIRYWVAVGGLDVTGSREGHRDHSVSDVANVKVVLAVLETTTLTTH